MCSAISARQTPTHYSPRRNAELLPPACSEHGQGCSCPAPRPQRALEMPTPSHPSAPLQAQGQAQDLTQAVQVPSPTIAEPSRSWAGHCSLTHQSPQVPHAASTLADTGSISSLLWCSLARGWLGSSPWETCSAARFVQRELQRGAECHWGFLPPQQANGSAKPKGPSQLPPRPLSTITAPERRSKRTKRSRQ